MNSGTPIREQQDDVDLDGETCDIEDSSTSPHEMYVSFSKLSGHYWCEKYNKSTIRETLEKCWRKAYDNMEQTEPRPWVEQSSLASEFIKSRMG